MAQQTLPVVTGEKDRSLQEVLARLTASRGPVTVEADPIVTAAHRLPAVTASFAPYPEGTDDRLRTALAGRGVEQLYTHQAEAFEHVLAGRNVVTITPTASGKTLCYNAPVLNAILKDPSTRALYLFPDQGARAGSARGAARAVRARHAGHGRARSASSRTTATRRPMRVARFAARRTWCSAIPTWCTRGSCRTIRAGRSCSRICASSSSTSCTPIAACSAATWRTSCAVCSASAATTDRIRSSSARRRRSPIRASSPRA